MALNHRWWLPLADMGFYGVSFVTLLFCVLLWRLWLRRNLIHVSGLALAASIAVGSVRPRTDHLVGPRVAGIQFEFTDLSIVLRGLNNLVAEHPETELVVLSEYSFSSSVPERIRQWCRVNQKYLVAGGKVLTGDGPNDFLNTAFVIDPTGEIVHKQVKAVPIQFFHDGQPARNQQVWQSPWGPIGLAICYDMSYSRVIDELVHQGARGLIIPTLDAEHWGEAQHELHAKMGPVRAREYRIPIFRVASSGISQLITAEGQVVACAPFPGQGKILHETLQMSSQPRIPWDRALAIPAVVVATICLGFAVLQLKVKKALPDVAKT